MVILICISMTVSAGLLIKNSLKEDIIRKEESISRVSWINEDSDENFFNGEKLNSDQFVATHKSLLIGETIILTNPKNFRSVIVKVSARLDSENESDLVITSVVAEELDIKNSITELKVLTFNLRN